MPPARVACHECDLLNAVPPLPPDRTARCARCGARLYGNPANSLDKALSLALASAILYVLALSFPFLSFGTPGNYVQTSLMTGVLDLYRQGLTLLAGVVLITSILAPAMVIGGYLYLLLPLHRGRIPTGHARMFRFLRELSPWNMIEVFLLGILVSLVKLGGMAEVVPGIAVWAFASLIITLAWTSASFEPAAYWQRVEQLQ
jgi:paraquat-inducible protein A